MHTCTCMARRKSLAGSNASRAHIPLPVHGFGPTYMASTTHMDGVKAPLFLCMRLHHRCVVDAMYMYMYVHGRCVADATWYMHGICTRRALITFLNVMDIYTYASSESTPLLHDSLPRFPLGNYPVRLAHISSHDQLRCNHHKLIGGGRLLGALRYLLRQLP